jgi:hypothetical protein
MIEVNKGETGAGGPARSSEGAKVRSSGSGGSGVRAMSSVCAWCLQRCAVCVESSPELRGVTEIERRGRDKAERLWGVRSHVGESGVEA